MRKAPSVLVFAGIASLALLQPAYAYLDPGTGSIMLQAVIGGIAGGLFVIKMQWARLKGCFRPKPIASPEARD